MNDELQRDIGLPLAGDDNEPVKPLNSLPDDDLEDPIDRELEEELDKTHPIPEPNSRPVRTGAKDEDEISV